MFNPTAEIFLSVIFLFPEIQYDFFQIYHDAFYISHFFQLLKSSFHSFKRVKIALLLSIITIFENYVGLFLLFPPF